MPLYARGLRASGADRLGLRCFVHRVQSADLASNPAHLVPTMGNSLLRSPPAGLPLRSFNKIEAHLIMHFLTTNEILKFSRCNQALRAMADDPFAWRHAVLMCSTKQLAHSPSKAVHVLAARCASVTLVLNGPLPKIWHRNPPAEVLPTLRLLTTKVREIRVATDLPFGDWSSLFSIAGFGSHIRCIDMTSADERPPLPSTQVLQLIVHLPGLETLRSADHASHLVGSVAVRHWTLLAQAPALTELSIRDTHRSMEPIAHCRKLRKLAMKLPCGSYCCSVFHSTSTATPQQLMERFCSASLTSGQRLETLSIDFPTRAYPFGGPVDPARAVEFVATCFSMPALASLTVTNHTLEEEHLQSLAELLPPHIKHEGDATLIRFRMMKRS